MVETPPKTVVLHIVYSGLGGIASVFFSLVEASRNENVKHIVAFYGVEPTLDDYITHCESLGIKYRSFLRRPKVDLRINNELNDWITQIKPDVIVVNLPRSLLAATRYLRKNPETILIGVEHHPNILKRTIDWLDSIHFMRHCTYVVYLTDTYKQEVANKLRWFFKPKKSVVIPNGINTEKFSPSEQPNCNGTLSIGMCSRLSSSKDIATLIQAFAISSKVNNHFTLKLTLAGDGPEKSNLQAQVARLNLEDSVVFEGFLKEKDLIQWLQNLDIYVHASLSETMSTSIMQALSCGLPCIVSDLPGMSELIPPDIGYVVPTKQPKRLSDKISLLLENKEKRIQMGSKARAYANQSLSQTLSWSRYQKLCSTHTVAD